MKCPRCKDPRIRYVQGLKRGVKNPSLDRRTQVRTNFHASCKKCGFMGVL